MPDSWGENMILIGNILPVTTLILSGAFQVPVIRKIGIVVYVLLVFLLLAFVAS